MLMQQNAWADIQFIFCKLITSFSYSNQVIIHKISD